VNQLPAGQDGTAVASHIGEDGLLVWFAFGKYGHHELVHVSDPWGAGGDPEGVSDRQRGGGTDLEHAVDAHKPHPQSECDSSRSARGLEI